MFTEHSHYLLIFPSLIQLIVTSQLVLHIYIHISIPLPVIHYVCVYMLYTLYIYIHIYFIYKIYVANISKFVMSFDFVYKVFVCLLVFLAMQKFLLFQRYIYQSFTASRFSVTIPFPILKK